MRARVVLSPRAEETRTGLPIPTRRAVNAALRRIAEQGDWGASPTRFLSPADSPNSGLIADLSVGGYAIVYRVKQREGVVWVEDIRPIFLG
ncbi:MAG: hypothetical protein XU10_C0006G0092 [Chloroflexi bacterium CSP1-4]|nr:MAG: hypothetical protein XU10_C0006G0092 [Chloroflexi bacterium CSP1-4]